MRRETIGSTFRVPGGETREDVTGAVSRVGVVAAGGCGFRDHHCGLPCSSTKRSKIRGDVAGAVSGVGIVSGEFGCRIGVVVAGGFGFTNHRGISCSSSKLCEKGEDVTGAVSGVAVLAAGGVIFRTGIDPISCSSGVWVIVSRGIPCSWGLDTEKQRIPEISTVCCSHLA
jgi:hypothetical protein